MGGAEPWVLAQLRCLPDVSSCSLFERAPVALLLLDVRPEPPTILAANAWARRTFDLRASERAEWSLASLFPPQLTYRIRQMVSESDIEVPRSLRTIFASPDGTARPMRVRSLPMAELGHGHLLLSLQDLSTEIARRRSVDAIDKERLRIAHELHDTFAQNLAALRLRVTLWHELLDADPAQLHDEFDEALADLRADIEDVRRMIYSLRPAVLDEAGLHVSLQRLVSDAASKYGFQATLDLTVPPDCLQPDQELTLLRVVQEAVNNVWQHAGAAMVVVEARPGSDDTIVVTVRDDGVGFDAASLLAGDLGSRYGLAQMRERVESHGGTLRVSSRPGEGTELRVALPCDAA